MELPEFPATPAAAVEDEFEIPELEVAPEAPETEAKKPSSDPADSDWDFDIEEADGSSTPKEFDIDLDSSHQQPHKS